MRSEPRERRLDLRTLMDDLLQDKVIGSDDHRRILNSSRSKDEALLHPLSYIAAQNLTDTRRDGRLDMGQLLHWLSKKVEQPLFHLDPLKVDVPAITEVMSFEFAQRHHILAVHVSSDEVTIASAEPNVGGWKSNLEHVLRRPIKRVLIDPADLKRYTVEFYSLAKSVRGASGSAGGGSSLSSVTNFEQLLELGDMKDPDANDQHIVNIVDWILQYAFDQRASDIHIEPRREVGNVRFRIDGVLYTVS